MCVSPVQNMHTTVELDNALVDDALVDDALVDDALVKEALELTQLKTEKALANLAIEELVRARKKKNLLDLAGKIKLHEGYDHKALQEIRSAAH